MSDIAALVADNLDIWTGAIERKNGAGRGGGGKRISLYGIERLRGLILDLAVRGKLVPQDASDEPASAVLSRLSVAMDTAVRRGRFRVPAKMLPVDVSGELPRGWSATRLGAVVRVINGRAYKKQELLESGTPVLRVGNLFTSNDWYYSDLDLEEDKYIDDGDLIYAWSASFGPFIWSGGRVIYHYHIWKLEPYSDADVSRDFLRLFLANETAAIKASGHGIAMLHMTKERMEQLRLDLPPLAEQCRIVAKVDDLMALCDELERESADALAAHQTLVEALLDTLVNSVDAAELATNWARLESHFDTLFTTDASIEALKQTILDLAVRGKLVEQDTNDEPVILKIKGQQSTPPFVIPANWRCVPLQALGRQVGGGTPSKSRADFWNGPIPWVSPKDMKRDYLATAEMTVTEAALAGSAVKLIAPESLMFVVRGMILAHSFPVAIATTPLTINQDMKAIELDDPLMAEYLLRALKGLKPLMLARVERSSHGTCRLDSAAYGSFPVPVPPLAEQHRIVAKVDELLALCDALKARLSDTAETRRNLADAIVERATA